MIVLIIEIFAKDKYKLINLTLFMVKKNIFTNNAT